MPPPGVNNARSNPASSTEPYVQSARPTLQDSGYYAPEFHGPQGRSILEPHFVGCNEPQSRADRLSTAAESQIKLCLEHKTPLMAFHSQKGFSVNLRMMGSELTQIPEPTRKPTIVEHLLRHEVRQPGCYIAVQGVGRVRISRSSIETNLDLRMMRGAIEICDQATGELHYIPFLEMAPSFDGHSVPANELKTCFREMQAFRQKESDSSGSDANTSSGLFASAMGIGRAAALVAMDVFKTHLDQNPAMSDQELQSILMQIRAEGQATGNPQFLHSDCMLSEVLVACREIKAEAQISSNAEQVEPSEGVSVTLVENLQDSVEILDTDEPELKMVEESEATNEEESINTNLDEFDETDNQTENESNDSFVVVEFDDNSQNDSTLPYETADEFSDQDHISYLTAQPDELDDVSIDSQISIELRLENIKQDKQNFQIRAERNNRSRALPYGLAFPSLLGTRITRLDPKPAWAMKDLTEAKAYLDDPELKADLSRHYMALDTSRSVGGLPRDLRKVRREVDQFRGQDNLIMERIKASLTLFSLVRAPEHEEFQKDVVAPSLERLFNGQLHQPTLDRLSWRAGAGDLTRSPST